MWDADGADDGVTAVEQLLVSSRPKPLLTPVMSQVRLTEGSF
jgi:hypothetical protein